MNAQSRQNLHSMNIQGPVDLPCYQLVVCDVEFPCCVATAPFGILIASKPCRTWIGVVPWKDTARDNCKRLAKLHSKVDYGVCCLVRMKP